ncbi:MoaD/ThiS family protein [Thermofilum pendens]|uniref:MoaD family protein n=1 Tax=Thermofilum pendens (strain DSM 2475 / Hrk 5) TaxID=368408 RepID=A1RWZ4_THEPD|nr:MoaD family protein [Thermofilum pendens]ABL77724.1 MoaD family protein [Thermofilum pendens Hrk 5]
MKLQVRYVSLMKDKTGKEQEEIELDAEEPTLEDLLRILEEKYGVPMLSGEEEMLVLVNGRRSGLKEKLSDGSQVVIAPPVSGG